MRITTTTIRRIFRGINAAASLKHEEDLGCTTEWPRIFRGINAANQKNQRWVRAVLKSTVRIFRGIIAAASLKQGIYHFKGGRWLIFRGIVAAASLKLAPVGIELAADNTIFRGIVAA